MSGLKHSWIFSKILAKLTKIFDEHERSIKHYPTSLVQRKRSIPNAAKIFFQILDEDFCSCEDHSMSPLITYKAVFIRVT